MREGNDIRVYIHKIGVFWNEEKSSLYRRKFG